MSYPSQHMNPYGHQGPFPPPHAFASSNWNHGNNAPGGYNDLMLNDNAGMNNLSGMPMDGLGISNGNTFAAEPTPFANQQRSFNAYLPQLAQTEVRMESRLQEVRARVERLESMQRMHDDKPSTLAKSPASNDTHQRHRHLSDRLTSLQTAIEDLDAKCATLERDLFEGFTSFKEVIIVMASVFGRSRELSDEMTGSEKRRLAAFLQEDDESDGGQPHLSSTSSPSHGHKQ